MLADFSKIDAATAKRLIDTYIPIARMLWRGYPWMDRAELRAVSEDAIFEAYASLDAARASEATWVRRKLFWALARAAQGAQGQPATESLDKDPQIVNGISPEREFWRQRALASVPALSPRHQTIVMLRMDSFTFDEIGEHLGISCSRASKEGRNALAHLRAELRRQQRKRP